MSPAEIRFEVRKRDTASRLWNVYDRTVGSWPYRRPGIRDVAQDADQATAEAEARRLAAYYQEHP